MKRLHMMHFFPMVQSFISNRYGCRGHDPASSCRKVSSTRSSSQVQLEHNKQYLLVFLKWLRRRRFRFGVITLLTFFAKQWDTGVTTPALTSDSTTNLKVVLAGKCCCCRLQFLVLDRTLTSFSCVPFSAQRFYNFRLSLNLPCNVWI